MLRRVLTLFLLTTFFSTLGLANRHAETKANQAELVVSWVFDIQMDDTGTPRGKVSLFVNGRVILLRPAVIGEYSVVQKTDFKNMGVPATAISACSGWWAGQGEDLYVVRRKKQLVVYIRYLDEGTSVPPFRHLKTIPL